MTTGLAMDAVHLATNTLEPSRTESAENHILRSFAIRLAEAVHRKKNPVVVGLDPRLEQLPDGLISHADTKDLAKCAQAYLAFCRHVIDVVAPLVPVVKPQAAFFEQLGPHGMVALGEVIRHAHEAGLIVILDGKRHDIASTAEAYAEAYLGPGDLSPWGADAMTIGPYLGEDSVNPFVKVAKRNGAGVFVLVKTSNPGGGMFQDLLADGTRVYGHVARFVERIAGDTCDESGYGLAGAVVGATYPEQLVELRRAMPHSWLLLPGYGHQGGTAADVASAFDDRGLGALVSSSRAVIFAHSRPEYSQRFGAGRWQQAVEAATRDMIAEIRDNTSAGRLG